MWWLVHLKHSDGSLGAWQIRTWSEDNARQECHLRYPGCWVEKVVYLGKD